jgi:RNA polymerase sigma-70 factor (ECF subfamily)
MSPDRVALLRAIRELPEKQRTAIALHHLADTGVTEVAAIMGAPVGTVKSWLTRGRATLAALLGDEDDHA